METIKQFFSPPVFGDDESKTRRARLLHIILVAQGYVLLLSLAGTIYPVLTGKMESAPEIFVMMGGLLLILLWRILMWRGQVNAASIGMLIFFTLSVTMILAMGGTIRSAGVIFFPLVVVMAVLLINKRAGVVFFIFTSLVGMGLVQAEMSGLLPAPANQTTFSSHAIIISGMGLTLVLLYLATQGIEDALQRASKNELEVRWLASTLEQSVDERTAAAEHARTEAASAQAALRTQLDETNAIARIAEAMRGEQDLVTLSRTVLSQLCVVMGASMGAMFVCEGDLIHLLGSYAYTRRKNVSNHFHLGEGLVGQAVLEKQTILITNAPADYISVASGLMELAPRVIMAVPFMRGEEVLGVIELASLNEFTEGQMQLLNKALENIAIAFSTAQARMQINTLLEQTQQQAQELRVREEELKSINEELQTQAENLRASQERLRRQQTELETANSELEERTSVLQQQRSVLDQQNRELTEAQDELRRNAEELTLANKYKSEFLANMSHELRTPLNSLLILARMLTDNEQGNLTPDQVESSRIIFNSGTDLLNLINEILDLSKVEAGRMTFHFAPMELNNLAVNMNMIFGHVAEEKHLNFEVSIAEGLIPSIETDQQRVEQIIKNFLSNAFKFTSEGGVKLHMEAAGRMVAIRVSDSGIGMTPEQQARVFEAFQQADGSTSRKYGGTGLGLTISKELANRLGGRIELTSELDKGSTFTLFLPVKHEDAAAAVAKPKGIEAAGQVKSLGGESSVRSRKLPAVRPEAEIKPFVDDDRAQVKSGDKVLLVIEDDPNFAKIVMDYGHSKGFKCVVAADGESGLTLAKKHTPDAILLDLKLPGMSGWEVLDALKHDSTLRHIPVHILSASEETMDVYKRGALGFLSKPISQEGLESVFEKIGEFISRNIRTLLIVEDDSGLRHSVRQLLGGSDVKISESESGSGAMELLRTNHFDCMILDLSLPDMTGFELLNRINQDETVNKCPVIVYTGKELSEQENEQLLKYANSVIIKGVKSPERLLDETALFLHRVVAEMPEEKQDTIRRLHDRNAVFKGKHVLVVDDDMRNAFALSRLLSDKGLRVSLARSGSKALEMLDNDDGIDLVLMDIMMPEMDGYETMQRIRAQQRFKNLPILALTAKAMKGDLEKCIEAGANDYMSKPVDVERLFSMLRVWLYR
jgi:CheY-like chemotaxis protein